MERISIGRLESHPEAAGVIEPESKRWQLVIDKEGFPHLYIRVDAGEGRTGLLCVEDCMNANVRALMTEASAPASPEDTALGLKEFEDRRASSPIPCPIR